MKSLLPRTLSAVAAVALVAATLPAPESSGKQPRAIRPAAIAPAFTPAAAPLPQATASTPAIADEPLLAAVTSSDKISSSDQKSRDAAAKSDRDGVIPPIANRFASPTDETPDFQKHISPLLGRLGCNGRACHGSFKGQGDFRLSLFGYNFPEDHEQITKADYSRIDTESPELSMLLMKPTLEDQHGGGKRMDVGSWQYNVLHRWIKAGTPGLQDESLKLTQLQITPAEIVFGEEGKKVQLKAVAVWSDGRREDVTALCRFQTNNPTVAEVNEAGQITSGQAGDTHIVVSYDSGVVPVPVLRPVSEKYGDRYPTVATHTKVDSLIVGKLSKLGIIPSEVCTDSEFLRRVSLDLIGTLPPAWEVEAFLKDQSSDKRARKVDELLSSPAYAAWWTTRLCDWTGNNPDFANIEIGREQVAQDWYDWIYKRVDTNQPYDEIVEGIVMAVSREKGESFNDYCQAMCEIYSDDGKEFADRSAMPHYWIRTNFRSTEERAIGFAYTFLGIRIQCAQCHKHPFDQWTQEDFKQFESFFSRITYNVSREDKSQYDAMLAKLTDGRKETGNQLRNRLGQLMRKGTPVPLREVYALEPRAVPDRRNDKKKNKQGVSPAVAKARVLGGETINLNDYADPREPLMEWLRSPNNPYFARAFVNRVWASYFSVGIVNPPDDLSLANPPSNRPLLDYLTAGFIKNNYDMKWLHREILNSDAYQRSWKTNDTNVKDETNFSHAVHRRLPAEVAYDAIMFATSTDDQVKELLSDPSKRAIGVPGSGKRNRRGTSSYALEVFGRNSRESNCDCDRSNEASLLQTVYLQNDSDILKMLEGRGTWIGEVGAATGQSVSAKSDKESQGRARLEEEVKDRKQLESELKELGRKFAELRRKGKFPEAAQLAAKATRLRSQLAKSEASIKQLAASVRNSDKPEPRQVAKGSSDMKTPQIVEQAYLRTLSRYPTAEEMETAVEFVESAPAVADGARDLLWALLNTKEFIVNH